MITKSALPFYYFSNEMVLFLILKSQRGKTKSEVKHNLKAIEKAQSKLITKQSD